LKNSKKPKKLQLKNKKLTFTVRDCKSFYWNKRPASRENLGYTVINAGELNNDGIDDDLIVEACGANVSRLPTKTHAGLLLWYLDVILLVEGVVTELILDLLPASSNPASSSQERHWYSLIFQSLNDPLKW